MMLTILRLLSGVLAALRTQSELALANLALRQQLAVLHRQRRRPRIRKSDRVFWLVWSRFWGSYPSHRSARDRSTLASKTLCLLLDLPLASEPFRSASEGSEYQRADSEDGEIQSVLGRTSRARGTPEAGNRHLGEDCFSLDAATKETTFPNLESIPG